MTTRTAQSGMMPMPASSAAPKYRADIDGLRAIAVLAVVIFHAGGTFLPGGFAGVDIFFVISGYLITTIVHREIQAGEFSIINFYERRIRRIYPALLAVLTAVVIAGLILFMPDELKDLGASLGATVAFCSNLLFWQTTDYFAGPAEFKPLLHTWSLAVEEQFYIVLPLLLVMLHRYIPKAIKPTILLLTICSFAASCLWASLDPSGNYYLPHTRAWELLFGSILALNLVPELREGKVRQILAVIALIALFAPLFLLDENKPFPAWNALPTVLGSAMIIHIGRSGSPTLASKFLSLKPMVAVGLISYSVYLVHWPLISFTRYSLMRELGLLEGVLLGAGSLLLGWISWRFIEQPVRNRKSWPRHILFPASAAASVLILVIGGGFFLSRGLPQRYDVPASFLQKDDLQSQLFQGCFMKGSWTEWKGDQCFVTKGDGKVTLLWGDSHANHYAPSLMKLDGQNSDKTSVPSILLYASAGCAPVLNIDFPMRENCRANNDQVMRIIDEYEVERVVLSSYWQEVFKVNEVDMTEFSKTIEKLQDRGVDVAIIGDNPDFPFSNPQYLALRVKDHEKPFYTAVRNDFDFNGRLKAASNGAEFYDPMEKLCKDEECLALNEGNILMRDNSHFSTYGADLLLQRLKPFQ